MLVEVERKFDLFGSHVRLLIGAPNGPDVLPPELAAIEIDVGMRVMHRELSRFAPGSELARLNRDPRPVVPASELMLGFVEAAVSAAEGSDGLVDPTVVDHLEALGYACSRAGAPAASLAEALAAAPKRAPAGADPQQRWRSAVADREQRAVRRKPGIRLDSGGIGKGWAADIAGRKLAGYTSFAVDCGGDLRVGGSRGAPRAVDVSNPLTDRRAHRFQISRGAVATSGLDRRIWKTTRGEYAHHIIDPATGRSAWTGLVQSTALARTALEAECLAKRALLLGPARGREVLARYGGLLIADDGTVEIVGAELPLDAPVSAAP